MSPLLSTVRCWICGNECRLENRKIDEHGAPVHKECHAIKVALEKAALQRNPATVSEAIPCGNE
jgi:hypothetical protein